MAKKRSPLLLQLLARMGELTFKEEWIPCKKGEEAYGCWEPEGGIIRVNVIPHVVDTVLHELLHATRPQYSERAVRSIVGKLLKGMPEEEMRTIYAEYKRRLEE